MNTVEISNPESNGWHDFGEAMRPAERRPRCAAVTHGAPTVPRCLALKPDDVKNGLGKLVLTLVELIRQLLERQALRRIESGSLLDVEIEKLGLTFMRLAKEMERLKREFGLEDEDLNLDLGPLGKLL